MNYTFKGNFGTLVLVVDDNGNASGTYQEVGTLSGTFKEGEFEGEWENKGMEGLVKFTVKEGRLNGKWKKGKDAGPMRGNWEGEQIGVQSQEDEVVEQEEANLLPDGWGTASAMAALIRHMMLADKKISDAEIMHMQQAMEHYDTVDIPLREVWDNIDDEMQIYEKLGLQGQILEKCAAHLAKTFDEDEIQHFWNILINVTVQDRNLHYYEYVALKYTTGILMPDIDFNVLTAQMRENGITVDDGSESKRHIKKPHEENLNKWSIIHDLFSFYTFFANLSEGAAQETETNFVQKEINKWKFEIDGVKYGLKYERPNDFKALADLVFNALYVDGNSTSKDPFIQMNESQANLARYFNDKTINCESLKTFFTSILELCQLRGITENQEGQFRWYIEQWSTVCPEISILLRLIDLEELKSTLIDTIDIEFDGKYHEAKEIILREGAALPVILCDALLIGKNRAERIFDQFERDGIVSPKDENGKRKIIKS